MPDYLLKQDDVRGSHQGDNTSTDREKRGSSIFSKTFLELCLVLLSTTLFALTAWFAQTTFSAEKRSVAKSAFNAILRADVGSALAILRVLQGLLAACSTLTLVKAFALVQWGLGERECGLRFLSLLGLSPTTGLLGTLGIVLTGESRLSDRMWASSKVLLVVALWLSGILLFIRTSLVTVYDPAYSYNVTAGVGQFNGSYVASSIDFLQSLSPEYRYQVVPYTSLATVYNLVVNSMHSTVSPAVRCQGDRCASYLFTGGLIMTTPWTPSGFPSYPLVKVYDVPALQLEFEQGPSEDTFSNEDCTVFGAKDFLIGIRLCVAAEQAGTGSLVAGLYVCTNGTVNGDCLTVHPTPNITTILSVYSRRASLVAARSNYSIITVSDLSPPSQTTDIDLAAYKMALNWLLNYTAANIPATSSIAENFWSGQDQLLDPSAYVILSQSFQSILAYPFWMFNANNYGNRQLQEKEIIPSLPEEFYTVASIVAPYTKIVINQGMFVAFLLLESCVLAFIWTVLLWMWFNIDRLPTISSYPFFDFVFKLEASPCIDGERMIHAGDADIKSMVKDVRVFVRKG